MSQKTGETKQEFHLQVAYQDMVKLLAFTLNVIVGDVLDGNTEITNPFTKQSALTLDEAEKILEQSANIKIEGIPAEKEHYRLIKVFETMLLKLSSTSQIQGLWR